MATPNINAVIALSRFGLQLPAHDYEAFAYFGSTNNVQTLIGYRGGSSGTEVGRLTFTYTGSGASNDDTVTSITLTLPTANY